MAKEGFIRRNKFSAMFGLVEMEKCVNTLLEKDKKAGRFGFSKEKELLEVYDGLCWILRHIRKKSIK